MKIKDSLTVYLSHRIIFFSLNEYINTLITRILNRMYEWEIHSNKKISGKEFYFKFFADKEISDVLLEIKTVYKDLNLKIFTLNKLTSISASNLEYLKEDNCVVKVITNIFKKKCKKYFIEKIPESFFNTKNSKTYKNIKCGEVNGDELEFLIKLEKI